MTNRGKYLTGAGIVGAALLAVAVATVENSGRGQQTTVAAQAPESTRKPAPAVERSPSATDAPKASADSPATAAGIIAPLPANATSVPDEDLLKLSGLVNLAGARDQPPDKNRWQQAIPIAQQLAQGPCDCEQRNWLNHFVEMGNYALSGADEQYYASAHLMAKLGRNDNQAMAISHNPN